MGQVKVISQRLGHRDVRVTLNTYAHAVASTDELVATGMEGMLLGDETG